jgi:predicted N-acyltransferase
MREHESSNVRSVASIGEIDPEAWDALVPDNPLCTHGWLRTVEETAKIALEPTYLLAYARGSSELRGASVSYMLRPNEFVLTIDDLMFGRFGRLPATVGLTFLPSVICRPLASHGAHVFTDPSASREAAAADRRVLLDALESIASSRGVGLGFSCVTEHESELLELLAERGYLRARQFPISFLDVQWGSFAGYLDHLKGISRRTARNIRNEINRARKAGIVVKRLHDAGPFEERLSELAEAQWRLRAGRPFAFGGGFFSSVTRNLGDGARVYGAFKNDDLVGFSLMVERGGVAYVPMIGIDPDRPSTDPTYFVLGYDQPIMDAIESGLTRIHFGEALYELKRRRGCRTLQTRLCYRASTRVGNVVARSWFAFHSQWMRLKVGRDC